MNSSTRFGWVIAAALAWGCGGAPPEESAEPAPTNEASTSGDERPEASAADEPTFPMPTSEFLGMVTVEATPGVCGDESPFRVCYPSLDPAQCANAFGQAMLACGEAMASTLPPTVDEGTADSVAQATAACAGQAFRQGLEQAGVPRSAECDQPAE